MSAASSKFDPIQLRPTVVEVNLDALLHNFRTIRAQVGRAKVMPVVKANAYGHGIIPCARALEEAGADALGVGLLEEGIAVRLAGVKIPVLILGGIFENQLHYFLEHNLEILASSVSKLKAIDANAKAAGKRARVHLDIDTGMERVGVHYYNSDTLFEAALECTHCDIVGVCSHLASQEGGDSTLTGIQLERFAESLRFYEKRSMSVPCRHVAASGAIMQTPEAYLDMVRPGLMLYGVSPSEHLKKTLDLKPVLSLKSKVVYFKVVKKGAGVSYDHLWTAPHDTRVVTVPIGYGDGYARSLTNRGPVLIRGVRHSIAGVVCMDQLMVNIGPDGIAYNGDEAVLIGQQGAESITVEELSLLTGQNPRELLSALNARLPKHYLLGGKEQHVAE